MTKQSRFFDEFFNWLRKLVGPTGHEEEIRWLEEGQKRLKEQEERYRQQREWYHNRLKLENERRNRTQVRKRQNLSDGP